MHYRHLKTVPFVGRNCPDCLNPEMILKSSCDSACEQLKVIEQCLEPDCLEDKPGKTKSNEVRSGMSK